MSEQHITEGVAKAKLVLEHLKQGDGCAAKTELNDIPRQDWIKEMTKLNEDYQKEKAAHPELKLPNLKITANHMLRDGSIDPNAVWVDVTFGRKGEFTSPILSETVDIKTGKVIDLFCDKRS